MTTFYLLLMFVVMVVPLSTLAQEYTFDKDFYFEYTTEIDFKAALDGSLGENACVRFVAGVLDQAALNFQYHLPSKKLVFVNLNDGVHHDVMTTQFPNCIAYLTSSLPVDTPTPCIGICGGATICRCEDGMDCAITSNSNPCPTTSTCTLTPSAPFVHPPINPHHQLSPFPTTQDEDPPPSTPRCVPNSIFDYQLVEILIDQRSPRATDFITRALSSWLSFCLVSVQAIPGDVTNQWMYIYGATTPSLWAKQTCSYANFQMLAFQYSFIVKSFISPVPDYSVAKCTLPLFNAPTQLACGTQNDLEVDCHGKKCAIGASCGRSADCTFGVCASGRCSVPRDWDLSTPPDQSNNRSNSQQLLPLTHFITILCFVVTSLIVF